MSFLFWKLVEQKLAKNGSWDVNSKYFSSRLNVIVSLHQMILSVCSDPL